MRPAGFPQVRISRLGHEKRSAGIGIEHPVPLLQGDRLQHRGFKRSRVIDQDVQPAKLLHHGSDCRLNTIDIAHIAGYRHGPDVELLQSAYRLLRFRLGTVVSDGNVRSSGG